MRKRIAGPVLCVISLCTGGVALRLLMTSSGSQNVIALLLLSAVVLAVGVFGTLSSKTRCSPERTGSMRRLSWVETVGLVILGGGAAIWLVIGAMCAREEGSREDPSSAAFVASTNISVIVLTTDIQAGAAIKKADLNTEPRAALLLPLDGVPVSELEKVVGRRALFSLQAGEVLRAACVEGWTSEVARASAPKNLGADQNPVGAKAD